MIKITDEEKKQFIEDYIKDINQGRLKGEELCPCCMDTEFPAHLRGEIEKRLAALQQKDIWVRLMKSKKVIDCKVHKFADVLSFCFFDDKVMVNLQETPNTYKLYRNIVDQNLKNAENFLKTRGDGAQYSQVFSVRNSGLNPNKPKNKIIEDTTKQQTLQDFFK